jgi:hypothetical protein
MSLLKFEGVSTKLVIVQGTKIYFPLSFIFLIT